MSAAALALLQTASPDHLKGPAPDLALLGGRVWDGAIAQTYRRMSLLIHPDKHNQAPQYVEAFQRLGSIFHRIRNLKLVDIRAARLLPWRYPAEWELQKVVCRSQKLPVPPDPASPPSSSTAKAASNNPPAVLHQFEWINLSTARRAQDLMAMRSLCIGGDASRSLASVI